MVLKAVVCKDDSSAVVRDWPRCVGCVPRTVSSEHIKRQFTASVLPSNVVASTGLPQGTGARIGQWGSVNLGGSSEDDAGQDEDKQRKDGRKRGCLHDGSSSCHRLLAQRFYTAQKRIVICKIPPPMPVVEYVSCHAQSIQYYLRFMTILAELAPISPPYLVS